MGMKSCVFGMAVTVTVLMMGEASWALQAGGVEVGDLESGSVVGQRFKELSVDLDIHATEIGGLKVLYPPMSVLDLKSRPGTPVLVRVTNRSTNERGFLMTASANQAAPTVLNVQLVLKPGETKYIGIPTSDLLYAAGATFVYRDHLNPKDAGGTLLLIK
ncbi:MAG: hypothetical protein E8D48_12350 [Nitrospira sp.]|nr:MAG: hypothetical protein E8D48_12350 [Nitrospira sp.]